MNTTCTKEKNRSTISDFYGINYIILLNVGLWLNDRVYLKMTKQFRNGIKQDGFNPGCSEFWRGRCRAGVSLQVQGQPDRQSKFQANPGHTSEMFEKQKTTTRNPTNKQKQDGIYKNLKVKKKYSLISVLISFQIIFSLNSVV